MIIDAVMLIFAVFLTVTGIVIIIVIRPAARRRQVAQRKAARDREIERMQKELHLDQ